MTEKYSHRERIEAIIAGEKPDRPAASIWRHFYHRETSAENLAGAMLEYQEKFDWDFMKINPRASYHVEDWGNTLEWSTDEFKKHTKTGFAVGSIDDWQKIGVLSPEAPVLAEHLKAIRMIRKGSDPNLPLLMTVFCPLGIARYLAGSTARLKQHLGQAPEKVIPALENITGTFELFAAECLNAGADGLFYATLEWASSDNMTYEDYKKYGRPYDLRILKAVRESHFNTLHVCHDNNFLKELSDYPVPIINWDDSHPTNPTVERAFGFLGDRVAAAGLDDKGWLWHSRPSEIHNEIDRLKSVMAGKQFIFAPTCAVAPEIPEENIRAVRESL